MLVRKACHADPDTLDHEVHHDYDSRVSSVGEPLDCWCAALFLGPASQS